jgi:carboxymethylenebutenolidase
MSSNKSVIRLMALVLASCFSFVSGCESGSSGSVEEAAVENSAGLNEQPTAPDPQPLAEPEIPVVAERLPYAEVDDELVYGHFVFPADMIDPLPAVILVHESWGLNDSIRARANRLAAEGFIVLAVDLFGGSVASNPAEARLQMVSVVENVESAQENIRQAYAFVRDTAGAPRIGSVGWDFGGGWSLNTAMLFPDELDAAVIVYGQVTDDHEALNAVNVPILGLFAGKDRSVTEASVRRFETALESLRKNYEIHVYPDADHSFADPIASAYDQETAEDATRRILEFLDLHLSINASESPSP